MLLGILNLSAQVDAGQDVTICNIQTVDLSADYTPNSVGTNDYSIESIALNMDPSATGTGIATLTDDSYSGIIDVGFDFCFYGNVYNQLLISTNNYVTFDLTEANGYSPWNTYEIPSAFPPGQVLDAIMGPWMDLNPANGGTIYYTVYGVAPFRRFVISFEDFGYYSCAGMAFNGQIKLFETTNVIEVHIQDQPLCATWNNGESVLNLIEKGFIKSAHDVSLGGILTAVSKMCIRGNKGIKLEKSKNLMNDFEFFFSEDQGRYIVEIEKKDLKEVTKILDKNSVHHEKLGVILDKDVIINEKTKVTIDELKAYNNNWLINYMNT